MEIAVFQPRASYYVGGGEIIPILQVQRLAGLGHSITLVTIEPPDGIFSEQFLELNKVKNVRILYVTVPSDLRPLYKLKPGNSWKRWDLESIHIGREAAILLSRVMADIFIAHNTLDSIALPHNKPSLIHLHGYPEVIPYGCELALFPRKRYIACSRLIKDRWSTSVPADATIEVCENGVDTDQLMPQSIKKKYDLIYFGRLEEIKGVQYLLEAVKFLRKKNRGVNLAVAGSGSYGQDLRDLVSSYGINDSVSFLGYVPEADKAAVINSARLAVFPSYAREGIMTTMLEAAACGVPTVTTEGTSMAEFIKEGYNGFLVAPKDSLSLARKIDHILANPALIKAMGQNSRIVVEKSWSWPKKIKELEKIYVQCAT